MESAFRFNFIPWAPSCGFCSGIRGLKALGAMEILMILRLYLRLSYHDWPCLEGHFRSLKIIPSFLSPPSDPWPRFPITSCLLDMSLSILLSSQQTGLLFDPQNYQPSLPSKMIWVHSKFIAPSQTHTYTHTLEIIIAIITIISPPSKYRQPLLSSNKNLCQCSKKKKKHHDTGGVWLLYAC